MKSYRSHVNNQNEQNPSTLGPLRDFLNDPQSDQQVSRLGVLEFTQLNSPPVYRQLDHQCLLHDLISEDISITEPCSLYGRIILVENISRGVMEILGSVLDIDPIFFESHIGHYDCSKDPMFEAEGDSVQKFLTCHYPRAVTLEGVQGYSESKKYVRKLNVGRSTLLLHSKPEGTFNTLIQHHCSVWVKYYEGGGWLGMSTLISLLPLLCKS